MKSTVQNNIVCTRCVMDSSASDISFDENGVCSYCREFLQRSRAILFSDESVRLLNRETFIQHVKRSAVNKKYDCIVGISGGVDSAWALYQTVELGLRPLAVHMDNGWNSELAQSNIENLVKKLGVDLYTYVINWNEYRSLMQAFFDSDVIDVELLYDNAMLAVNYNQASKYGLKYILAGTNQSTEGMRMPANWNWFKHDKKNIKAIVRKFSNISIKTFPALGSSDYLWYKYFKKITWIPFLDFFKYDKKEALKLLQDKFGYKPYPYKHYESVFTRFYQGYILPGKFGVDKRKLHLSTLIISGQMSRDEALKILEQEPYVNEKALAVDIEYFLKKMNWSRNQLNDYLSRPEVAHDKYSSEKRIWDWMLKTFRS